jgi:putrescine transport system ATP-binding protein
VDVAYLGDTSVYRVKLDNGLGMRAAVANRTRLIERPIGADDRVWLSWRPEAGVVLKP